MTLAPAPVKRERYQTASVTALVAVILFSQAGIGCHPSVCAVRLTNLSGDLDQATSENAATERDMASYSLLNDVKLFSAPFSFSLVILTQISDSHRRERWWTRRTSSKAAKAEAVRIGRRNSARRTQSSQNPSLCRELFRSPAGEIGRGFIACSFNARHITATAAALIWP